MYYRYFTDFTDEIGLQYRLYIYPSNANLGTSQYDLTAVTSYSLVELPDDFLKREMKLSTQLGDIPTGLVSQTLTVNVNIAACQGTAALDSLRESLLKGTMQKGYGYKTDNTENLGAGFDRFNTFVLLQTGNSGTTPIFIGCQKYAAENELKVDKLTDIISYKIECYDILRSLAEAIPNSIYYDFLTAIVDNTSIDFGSGTAPANRTYNDILIGINYYIGPDAQTGFAAKDYLIDSYEMYITTFDRLRTLLNAMLTQYMKSALWSTGSQISLPVLFAKAWTFYRLRQDFDSGAGAVITKPAFVSEIWKLYKDWPPINNLPVRKKMGGAYYDPTAFAKEGSFYELLKSMIENSLEIYRPVYSWSSLFDWFSVTYQADFLQPLTGSGLTFTSANAMSELSFKLFQETVKSAETSCSTLQGEKDSKVFPYSEQGTSGDNGKDLEIIFHNLPSPSGRNEQAFENGYMIAKKYSINAGMIVYNDVPSNTIERVDTKCQFKYSNTDSIALNYTEHEVEGAVNLQMIKEQQEAGLPYTLSYGIVKALGDAKQAEVKFKILHSTANCSVVGTNAVINLASFSTLLSDIYDSANATGVITKHEADIYSGIVEITMRTYE